MCISICPTRCKTLIVAIGLLFLAGCASEPVSAPSGGQSAAVSATPPVAKAAPTAPSVLIRDKSAAAILSRIVTYRTQKGMRIVQRDAQRVVLATAIPNSNPPAEARMMFSLAPAEGGQLLSAQVFRVVREKGKKPVTQEVTASLRDKLEAELAMYAKP